MGASSFVVSHRAFQGLTRTAAEDCALFLLPRSRRGQRERMEIGALEKLAQERLRGNRDRLAVGKRVGSCIRQVAHDLERMRGTGSLLHQYQTSASTGMVIAKLFNALEWYLGRSPVGPRVPRDRRPPRRPVRIHDNSNRHISPAFQNHGRGLRPSFFSRKQNRGKMKGSN